MILPLAFPCLLTANDYHEFGTQLESLKGLLDCTVLPPASKNLPQLDYYELGFVDGSYSALFYSPSLLGCSLTERTVFEYAAPVIFEQFNRAYLQTKNSLSRIPFRKIPKDFVELYADNSKDLSEYYNIWSANQQKEVLNNAVGNANPSKATQRKI